MLGTPRDFFSIIRLELLFAWNRLPPAIRVARDTLFTTILRQVLNAVSVNLKLFTMYGKSYWQRFLLFSSRLPPAVRGEAACRKKTWPEPNMFIGKPRTIASRRMIFGLFPLTCLISFTPPTLAMNDLPPHPSPRPTIADHYFLSICAQGEEAACRIALNKGANVAARDKKGRTPLHLIARCNNIFAIKNIIPLLIAHKADPEAKDDEGYTALGLVKLASERPFEKNPVVQILSKYDNQPNDAEAQP